MLVCLTSTKTHVDFNYLQFKPEDNQQFPQQVHASVLACFSPFPAAEPFFFLEAATLLRLETTILTATD